jgi:two-component system sensor histidine kinase KdpD
VGLDEIVARSLDDLGSAGRTVRVDIPPLVPEVVADPGILERVIVNLTGNALRYSPADDPPLLSASSLGERVELRVIDRGPGIPEADWMRIFVPFQRLGDNDNTTGVGLGLALSRGFAEAMGGSLDPEETPGGGLTMILTLPAAASVSPDGEADPGRRERETDAGRAEHEADAGRPEHEADAGRPEHEADPGRAEREAMTAAEAYRRTE